jgi:hypothetical protein
MMSLIVVLLTAKLFRLLILAQSLRSQLAIITHVQYGPQTGNWFVGEAPRIPRKEIQLHAEGDGFQYLLRWTQYLYRYTSTLHASSRLMRQYLVTTSSTILGQQLLRAQQLVKLHHGVNRLTSIKMMASAI